jgi:hypothetical protein
VYCAVFILAARPPYSHIHIQVYIHTLEVIWHGISAIYLIRLLCSNQLFDCFLLDKSNIVNDVPQNDDFVCLKPVFGWRCGFWSSHSFPYSVQVLPRSKLLFLLDPRNLADRHRYLYPIVSVVLL